MEDKRVVEIEGLGKVTLNKPSVGISKEADWVNSRSFNEAIKNGVLPAAILEHKLRESGAWTKEDDKGVEDTQIYFSQLSERLRNEKDPDKRKVLTSEWIEKKNFLYELMLAKSTMMSHSAERKADEKRFEFLLLRCCLKEDGTPIWKSSEDAYVPDQKNLFIRVAEEYMMFINNLNLNAEDVIPGEAVVSTPPEPVNVAADATKQ